MNYKWIFIGLFLCACNNDNSEKTKAKIIGNWHLFEAVRNGKNSKTLANTTYQFLEDGTMSSNLFVEQELNYQIKDNIILQEGKSNVKYEILKLSNDSLFLKTKIGRYRYILKLIK